MLTLCPLALLRGFAPSLLLLSAWSGLTGSRVDAADAPVAPVAAAAPRAAGAPDMPDAAFAVHGQFTYVEQESDSFHAPYAGANSLSPDQGRETTDATLYIGVRPWPHAEFWVTPEVDQGFGLDDTLGIAGFPSAEAYKVGRNRPYLRLPRALLRQVVDVGGATEAVEPDLTQLAGSHAADRWVFTVGKFGVPDVFDANKYAHDARNDFLNWTAVDAGSFDYAADAWGFTVGAAAERYAGDWTVRAGLFDLSTIPNSEHLDPGGHEFQMLGELEHRHVWSDEPGRLLLTVYDSRGRMGLLSAATAAAALTGQTPDVAGVRRYRSRLGVSLDLEQEVAADLGVFARLGKAAGNVEAFEFTDVDRSFEAGLTADGSAWHRRDDRLGLAVLVNGISADRERYLAAGGLGILVGDGQLPNPAAERIVETYYSLAPLAWARVSLDYQWVKNPAYASDRGPVSVFALRLHVQL